MDNVLTFANEILEMRDEIVYLRNENERLRGYEKKYNDLLNKDISHERAMVGQILALMLSPEIAKSIESNPSNRQQEDI